MLLNNKDVEIYGAGGAIGDTVACAFAREGAKLFLGLIWPGCHRRVFVRSWSVQTNYCLNWEVTICHPTIHHREGKRS